MLKKEISALDPLAEYTGKITIFRILISLGISTSLVARQDSRAKFLKSFEQEILVFESPSVDIYFEMHVNALES
jgi:hypothetical protein